MRSRLLAVAEAAAVFALAMLGVAAVALSPIGTWERRVTNRFFLEYAVMIAVPLVILLACRRNLASYGLSFRNPRYHLDVALTAFVPVAVSCIAYLYVDTTAWKGVLILVIVQVALLFVVGLVLKRKPTLGGGTALAALPPVGFAAGLVAKATLGNALSALLFYVFFLGLGEELLFRGYILSRLDIAFGKPFRFFGVPWGWGAVMSSALFGLMHALNLGQLGTQTWCLTPWRGLWTFFAGLVFAFVREKSGSIAASALLHGLPQGIASAFLGI